MSIPVPPCPQESAVVHSQAADPPPPPIGETPPRVCLAEVICRLQVDPDLSLVRKREMISALRSVARLLELDPAAIPAAPRELRNRLAALSPAAGGISHGRWNNIRSLTLAALRQAGVRTMRGRAHEPLAPVWQALRALLPDANARFGLSRFMSFCSTQTVTPEAVGTTTFAAFQQALDTDSLVKTPGVVYRTSCRIWNQSASGISGWPNFIATIPANDRLYALKWQDFPDSFVADADKFLHRLGNQDPFADDYAPSVKPSTVNMRRKQILQIATALVRSGQPASAITGLATLVQVPNATLVLRFFFNRFQNKKAKYLHQQALLLKTIARHWAKAGSDHVETLAKICRNLAIKHTGMTEKNRLRLRQFDNPANVSALVNLPRRVLDELSRNDDGGRDAALQAMYATAVELLTIAPIREENLTELRLDRHFVSIRAGSAKTLHLVLSAEETKNDAPYELEIPPDTAKLLATYRTQYHPRLSKGVSPWLFPNPAGERRSVVSFAQGISRFVLRETGIVMNVHIFRHTAAKLHLDAHPEDIETVRRILGHKNVTTTTRYYAETKTAAAFRRYGDLIAGLRDQSQISVRRGTGRGRS